MAARVRLRELKRLMFYRSGSVIALARLIFLSGAVPVQS